MKTTTTETRMIGLSQHRYVGNTLPEDTSTQYTHQGTPIAWE